MMNTTFTLRHVALGIAVLTLSTAGFAAKPAKVAPPAPSAPAAPPAPTMRTILTDAGQIISYSDGTDKCPNAQQAVQCIHRKAIVQRRTEVWVCDVFDLPGAQQAQRIADRCVILY